MRHLELEKLDDQKQLQRAETQIAILEKGSLEDRRELMEFQEKCKVMDQQNQYLEDQVRLYNFSVYKVFVVPSILNKCSPLNKRASNK